MHRPFSTWKYIPILAISPSEMVAIEQLPDKDKDQILPLFPLKGWMSSLNLEKTLNRINKSIKERPWIADIDEKYLTENKTLLFTGELPDKPIFQELKALLSPENAYENWYQFISSNERVIPCLRHENTENLDEQIKKLTSLNRGLALRIHATESNLLKHQLLLEHLRNADGKILIIYDLETIDLNFREEIPLLERLINEAKNQIQNLTVAISSSSFPAGFAGQLSGERSIYERLLFNTIVDKNIFSPIVYSDRGSARVQKQEGGSGTPPPRIDYPLKKDWKFVRREVEDDAPNSKERRRAAYTEIASEIISSDYWIPELRLWGTQQIEITAEENPFGIYSPQKSTAARINIHLFIQLHYDNEPGEIDTDEEWVD